MLLSLRKNSLDSLSRRLSATESIAVQWVLMAPPPDGFPPLTMGSCAIVSPFAPLKNGPPWLSHGSCWVAPPIRGWGHPSALLSVAENRWHKHKLFSGVAPANQTKERSVHELFAGGFQNKSSMWIVLVFLRKNTRIHKNGRNSWTFRFGPFFGLVCRGDSWSLPWLTSKYPWDKRLVCFRVNWAKSLCVRLEKQEI